MKKRLFFCLSLLAVGALALISSKVAAAGGGGLAATMYGLPTLRNVQHLAEDAGLSRYEGDEHFAGAENYGFNDDYTGYGDDHLDFGGQGIDFSNEIAVDRVFNIVLANTSGAAQTVLLCPSYNPSSTILVADGVIGGVANFTGSGSPKTIANLLTFISRNPTKLVAMKISATDATQLAQVINIVPKSPFKDLESKRIMLSSFTSESNQNDKMVTVPLHNGNYQFDDQTEWNLTIPNNCTTTISLYFGVTLNTAAALSRKAEKAGQNRKVTNSRALLSGVGRSRPSFNNPNRVAPTTV